MPVRYDAKSKKWCMGSRCVYGSKAKAMAAYRAYLAKGGKK